MAKKKLTVLLSLLVLPTACNVTSCRNSSIDRKMSSSRDENNNMKTKNIVNSLKNDDEVKKMNAQISKIKFILSGGIDGSKDFTPSQSLADPDVNKKILEKIKELCNNPENIRFIPKPKPQFFKAGSENYVNVEIVYTKKDFQDSLMYENLQIKNVKQDLQEIVDKATEDLKNQIDFSKSFLFEHDDLNVEKIKDEFINVLNSQLEQDDERLSIELVDKFQDLLNYRKIEIKVVGKDDNEEIIETIQVTPTNLANVDNYIRSFEKTILIIRKDKLFADSIYTPQYSKEEVINIIKNKFMQENGKKLRRELALFDSTVNDKFIKLEKGRSSFPVKIKLKNNKLLTNTALDLCDVENHPEYILNKIADYFETYGLDLKNEPIFKDSNFNSSNNGKSKICNWWKKWYRNKNKFFWKFCWICYL